MGQAHLKKAGPFLFACNTEHGFLYYLMEHRTYPKFVYMFQARLNYLCNTFKS